MGYPGVLLFYAPLFMLFQSDRRYIELKRAEEANLRNARFAAKGELAAGIGHELNNQLVAISARAQMLLKDCERQSFDHSPPHAQIILDQSKRMGVLAKGLMDYTRNPVNVEPMDLNGLLTSTIEFVKGDKRFRAVEWVVELDGALPQLRGDIGQIQGVFINLFVNAADAIDAGGGTITIKSNRISLSPLGSTQIKNSSCPKRHSLMDNDFKIDGLPSLKVKVVTGAAEGITTFASFAAMLDPIKTQTTQRI